MGWELACNGWSIETSEAEKIPFDQLKFVPKNGPWLVGFRATRTLPSPDGWELDPSRTSISILSCAHRTAVHAALWEASTHHAAADLHWVVAATGLLAEEAHGRLL